MDRTVKLYMRSNCHLCDDALAILRRHRVEPELIDVDEQPGLSEFHECVPVVEIDGKVRFRGRVNELLLKRLLKQQDRG